MNKCDAKLVCALGVKEKTAALVRVKSPMHLNALEHNFEITHRYPFIRTVGIMCGLNDAIRLERMQEVESVSAQQIVNAFLNKNIEADAAKLLTDININSEKQYLEAAKIASRKMVGETFSHNQLDGDGVTICVMDTGVSVHSDLEIPKKRIVHFVDMINGQEIPYDDNGHGTFVSGVAAGNGLLSGGRVCGVAPKANIIGLKVIGENGETGTFKILDGMQWLFDNAQKYGIRVVCMSFGADPISYSDPLKIGAEMLVNAGITVVCAAGNSGKGNLKSPGISPEVITVGAVNDDDIVADFSSYGIYQGMARPDLYARGVKLKGLSAGSTYSLMSGTSVSAPYVAGACCLLCQKYKNATPKQIKGMLLDSCYMKNGIKIFSLD